MDSNLLKNLLFYFNLLLKHSNNKYCVLMNLEFIQQEVQRLILELNGEENDEKN